VRPYERKFKGLEADAIRFGNHVRKINICDGDFNDDQRYDLPDGQSVDMYKVNKLKVLQTNFYGAETFERYYTVYRDQLDIAFSSMEEFGRFLAAMAQNISDQIEQAHESIARVTVANFITGKIKGDADNVVHLITKYNDVTGLALTADTVKQPDNYAPFIKWVYAYIGTLSNLLTERTTQYHINVTDHDIHRHTPKSKQTLYLYSPEYMNIEASVLSSVFNPSYLKLAYTELVNFWQSIKTPMGIENKPTYMLPDGTVTTEVETVTQSNVFGVLCDVEAMGYTTISQWAQPTPFNAAGGYTNMYFHFTDRYWNDFTENGIVLLLD
jgi:hypothetical protein